VIILEINTCPICGQQYVGPGALSRVDNSTEICEDCAIDQALDSVFAIIQPEKILDTQKNKD
jgi:ribosome-binding protein aMBF1 (putative translation factor)